MLGRTPGQNLVTKFRENCPYVSKAEIGEIRTNAGNVHPISLPNFLRGMKVD